MRSAWLAIPAALSALLLLAACALWVRSLVMTDDIFWYGESRMTRFRTSGGGFWFETRRERLAAQPRTEWQHFHDKANYPFAASADSPLHERFGFLVSTTGYDLLLVVPYWAVVLATLPFPLLWAWASKEQPA
jgi:hypothetical protein